MAQSNNILQELKELDSILATMPSQNVYSVPEGYFDGLAGLILNRVRSIDANKASDELLHLSPFLAQASKELPYTVPVGYFEGLDQNILQNIQKGINDETAEDELASLSPLLSGMNKQMPYSVPQGYFENIDFVPTKKPAAKVVSLYSRKWLKYAAAAVIIGILAVSVVLITGKEKLDPDTNSYSWVEKKMKKVSTDEIENFIELADESLPKKEIIASAAKGNEVKDMIKDIPENEIQAFLNDIPQDETSLEDEGIMN